MELFAIRCGINQATNHNVISKIIVITDSIHTARKIFDPSSHPFQKHSAVKIKEGELDLFSFSFSFLFFIFFSIYFSIFYF